MSQSINDLYSIWNIYLVSLKITCLRITGSYLRNSTRSGCNRLLLVTVYR